MLFYKLGNRGRERLSILFKILQLEGVELIFKLVLDYFIIIWKLKFLLN